MCWNCFRINSKKNDEYKILNYFRRVGNGIVCKVKNAVDTAQNVAGKVQAVSDKFF